MKYLREKAPGKAIFTNEMGVKSQFVSTPEEAAQDMVKKYVQLMALDVKLILWFSPAGDDGHNAAAIITSDHKMNEITKKTWETVARYFSDPSITLRDVSTSTMTRFSFSHRGKEVQIIWSKDNLSAIAMDIAAGSTLYDHRGRTLPANSAPSTAPIFMVCRK